MKILYRFTTTLFLSFFLTSMIHAQIAYVNIAATGASDGTSWTDAYTDLQEAITNAVNGEIWIASGTYTPTSIGLDTFNTFFIDKEIALYGGFAGDETSKEDRIDGENTTILSGDIMGNDIDNQFSINKEDNVFHVMTVGSGEGNPVILDGLTFSGGNTRESSPNDDYTWRGGGIYATSKLEINNCNFNNNFARSGGAIYLTSSSVNSSSGSTIDNCVFEKNSGFTQGAGVFVLLVDDVTVSNSTFQSNITNRGALYPSLCNNILIDNCEFKNNVTNNSTNFGGGMFIWNCTGSLINSMFDNNNTGNGGGLHIDGREMETSVAENFLFENCIFTGNSAGDFGGGAIRSFSASYTARDCQFMNNFGPNGGAIFSNGGGQEVKASNNTFTNNSADFGASQASYGIGSNFSYSNNTYTENASNTSGGALILGFGSSNVIDSCDFSSNFAGFGGAIYAQNDTTNVEIYNSNFTENNVGDGSGGAINIGGPVMVTVDNCIFRLNMAGFGGAINGNQGNDNEIDVIQGYLHLHNSSIILNTATSQGAGLSLIDLDLEMTNTVFGTNFLSDTGAGGGLSLNTTSNRSSTFNITNSTIADNFAFTGAGIATFQEDGSSECIVNLQNTILSNEGLNYEIEAGDPSINSLGGNLSTDATLDAILTNTGDLNNVQDVKFVNSANYNFDIENDSPAINIGISAGAPDTDILGRPRVGPTDAGAFENQDPLSIEVIENNGQLTMSPNPTQSFANISLSNDWTGDLRVSVLDVGGKLLNTSIQKKTAQEFIFTLDVNQLNAGKYILTIESESKKIASSFIKI